MARSNPVKRIVVVDCDLRRASVVSSLGMPATGGTIDEYLAGSKTLDQILGRDGSSGLYYVPARRNTPNSAEILNSDIMHAFVEHLAGEFDLVILDTPPLITVSDASSRPGSLTTSSSSCDGSRRAVNSPPTC